MALAKARCHIARISARSTRAPRFTPTISTRTSGHQRITSQRPGAPPLRVISNHCFSHLISRAHGQEAIGRSRDRSPLIQCPRRPQSRQSPLSPLCSPRQRPKRPQSRQSPAPPLWSPRQRPRRPQSQSRRPAMNHHYRRLRGPSSSERLQLRRWHHSLPPQHIRRPFQPARWYACQPCRVPRS